MVRNIDPISSATLIAAPQQFGARAVALLDRQLDDTLAKRPAAVDINMAGVELLDSAGLNWLVAAHTQLSDLQIPLRLVNASPLVADILIATRLDGRLNMQIAQGEGTGDA